MADVPPQVALTPSNDGPSSARTRAAIIVIGRNEGDRLVRCLASVAGSGRCVYVDSGSTDGSVERARDSDVDVVELAIPPAFTAARARNAGLAKLLQELPDTEFVQTVDGDCEILPGWLDAGLAALKADPALALVFGRLRERHPERSIYNALCDDEWDAPVGEASGSGGIALFRVEALRSVGGYNEAMIAGEDTELAMRLRKAGWRIACIGTDMALHDAAILSFRQWWRRAKRGGHGFAEMAWLHPDARWPNWPRTCRSIVAWGAVLPAIWVATLILALSSRWWLVGSLVLLALWPVKMVQLARSRRKRGLSPRLARASGVLLMVGKFPEVQGLLAFHWNRLTGRRTPLIEHKGPIGG